MKGLRVLVPATGTGHQGEIYCCAWAPDGAFVLSGGWDGHLRLWDAPTGNAITSLKVGHKAVSACTVSPDGRHWVSGSMEGLLGVWDAVTHQAVQHSMGHIRPISAVRYSPDGKVLATASWDRQIVLRPVLAGREGRTLSGHTDSVVGIAFVPGEAQLVSWSHDCALRLWDLELGRCLHTFKGHRDRVVAGALSPDGRFLASGSRDGALKLWDLKARAEQASVRLGELRAIFYLLDAESIVTVDSTGWALLLSVPGLEVQAELATNLKTQTGELSPDGTRIAVGSDEGQICLLAIDGAEARPLVVTPTAALKEKSSVFGRLLGKSRMTSAYRFVCPACRHPGEVDVLPEQALPCGQCRRLLRLEGKDRQLQPQ